MIEARQPAAIVRLSAAAVPVGIAAALAASVFLWLVEIGQEALFEWLPRSLGQAHLSWWWPFIPIAIGSAMVLVALRLPGAAGSGPLGGFHFRTPLRFVPSILLASIGSLVAGIALGPEAPLIVVGSTLGAVFAMRSTDEHRSALMFIGGMAAIGAVFGSPMVTAFMMLELMALGAAPVVLLIPSLVGLASSYLVQIGVWSIPGIGLHSLTVPGIPDYPGIEVGDFGSAAVVAGLAVGLALAVRVGATELERIPLRTLAVGVGAVMTAAVAGIAIGVFQLSPVLVLFGGNAGMGQLVAETDAVTIGIVLVAKALVIIAALGGGFRGGAIFPATFLGVAVGMLVHVCLPETGLAALVATGIATSAAMFTKLPATSALLAVLLIAGTGPAIAPFAILGAVLGVFGRIASDQFLTRAAALSEA